MPASYNQEKVDIDGADVRPHRRRYTREEFYIEAADEIC